MSSLPLIIYNMGMSWGVYLVQCKDRTLYCGVTNRLKHRLAKHNEGQGAKYTKGRGPVKLVYWKEYPNRSTAQKEEFRIKKLARHKKLLLAGISL